MSSACSIGQLSSLGGRGGATMAGECCGRAVAATADLTAVLWRLGWLRRRWNCSGLRRYGQAKVRVGLCDAAARAEAKRTFCPCSGRAQYLFDKMLG